MTPWTKAHLALLSSTASWSWVKFMLVTSMTLSSHFVFCRPFSTCLHPFPTSGSFPGSLLMRWLKYWSLIFRICPSSEQSGLISFRMDRFVLLAVQGLSRVSSSTIIQKHQFFGGQPSLWSSSQVFFCYEYFVVIRGGRYDLSL